MELNPTHSVPVLVKSAVLVIFVPTERTDHQLKDLMSTLAQSVQSRFEGLMGVLKIDETIYPDVVRSFAITHFPAYIIVSHGVELWRHEGALDESALVTIIQRFVLSS